MRSAAGASSLFACDFIYASEVAKFGQPEVNLGVIPGFGGTQRLARRVGIGRARELIYTGEIIGADKALSIGLANAVLAKDELLPRVRALATDIAGKAPLAVAQAKRTMLRGALGDLTAANELEAQAFAMLFGSDRSERGNESVRREEEAGVHGSIGSGSRSALSRGMLDGAFRDRRAHEVAAAIGPTRRLPWIASPAVAVRPPGANRGRPWRLVSAATRAGFVARRGAAPGRPGRRISHRRQYVDHAARRGDLRARVRRRCRRRWRSRRRSVGRVDRRARRAPALLQGRAPARLRSRRNSWLSFRAA